MEPEVEPEGVRVVPATDHRLGYWLWTRGTKGLLFWWYLKMCALQRWQHHGSSGHPSSSQCAQYCFIYQPLTRIKLLPGIRRGVGGVGQSAHACGVGDLKSRPAVMSGQRPRSVVHVGVWKRGTDHNLMPVLLFRIMNMKLNVYLGVLLVLEVRCG